MADTKRFDYIVLGSGVAGLRAAIELAAHGSVALVTKCVLGEGSSEYAQGGVAVVLSDDDDIFLHYEDTIAAGDGLCDNDAVLTLVEEGPRYINELITWGAKFDTHEGKLDFTREAAHSVNRIIHAHGDATGHEIVRTLKEKSRTMENIRHVEHMFASDLIQRDGRVVGVTCLNELTGEIQCFYAKGVIIATGGAGKLFTRSTNPEVSTGDGIAMAFRAGANLKDLEFYQFHPTALTFPGAPAFLLSESMRGEGAVLRNKFGDRFAKNYNEAAELAPRDVVARAIFFEMKKTEASHVYMDITHEQEDFVRNRFPKIYDTCMRYGIDIALDYIPVSPAAHYYMGGIETDSWGRTSIPGLYACGEAACTGVHGANRLASNSLLEGVVFGGRSAKALIIDTKNVIIPEEDACGRFGTLTGDAASMTDTLRKVMWNHVSLVRTEEGLSEAVTHLEEVLKAFEPGVPPSRSAGELKNLATVGFLMALAAKERKGSRGGHYREDHPERMEENWHVAFDNGVPKPVIR